MIYAMSDIHGCIDAFEKSLSFVDLSDGHSTLILCGDYCDRSPASLEVYQRIMELQRVLSWSDNRTKRQPRGNAVGILRHGRRPGVTQGWILADSNLATAKSFLEEDEFSQVKRLLARRKFEESYRFVVDCMKTNHADVLPGYGSFRITTKRHTSRSSRMPESTKTQAIYGA